MKGIKSITVLTNKLDSQNDIFDIKGVNFADKIHILKDIRNQAGTIVLDDCKLYKTEDSIKMDIPESFKIVDFKNCYPSVSLEYVKIQMSQTGTFLVDKCSIISVNLHENPNADESIKTIGEQLNIK